MATIIIDNIPKDVMVALARGAAENGDAIEDEARRVLMRIFSDSRGQAQQAWARKQADLYRWSKMLVVSVSPVEILRTQRLDRDDLISEHATVVLAS